MYKTTGIAGRSEREAELAGGLERFSGAGEGILIKKMKSRVEGSDQFRDFDELAAAVCFCSVPMLEINLRALHTLAKLSVTETHHSQ